MSYLVNEIFYSLQGEGVRAGTVNVFVRFSKCNLKCVTETHGFDCDTEFDSGVRMELNELVDSIQKMDQGSFNVIFTGGEPALQLDAPLIAELKDQNFHISIETNGTVALPDGINWITVSPKTAEHTLRVEAAEELKYVRAVGQYLPQPRIQSAHFLLSPAWAHDGFGENLEWCIQLCKENPEWRLSCQQHKWWNVR